MSQCQVLLPANKLHKIQQWRRSYSYYLSRNFGWFPNEANFMLQKITPQPLIYIQNFLFCLWADVGPWIVWLIFLAKNVVWNFNCTIENDIFSQFDKHCVQWIQGKSSSPSCNILSCFIWVYRLLCFSLLTLGGFEMGMF